MVAMYSGWIPTSATDVDPLPLPFWFQPHEEDAVAAYTLWTIIEYTRNSHPDKAVRENTRALNIDEIKSTLRIVKGGAKLTQDDLTIIGERTKTLQLDLRRWHDGSPNSLEEHIIDHLERDFPLIVYVNGPMLRNKGRDKDNVHPVVVAGCNDDHVALHDPMGDPKDFVESDKLKDAWDPMFNQIIRVDLSTNGRKLVSQS